MIVGDDTIHATSDTCTAVSAPSVCPRCGRSMGVRFTDGFGVAVVFACGCVRVELSFRDFLRVHGSETASIVHGACFAAWGERGAGLVPKLMQEGLQ